MSNDSTKCYFTGADCLTPPPIFRVEGGVYNSKLCGQYKFCCEYKDCIELFDKQKTACYLYYHKVVKAKCFLLVPFALSSMYTSPDALSQNDTRHNFFIVLTEKDVENWYPKTFAEKIDKILLKLHDLSAFEGDFVETKNASSLLFFTSPAPSSTISRGSEIEVQCNYIVDYLDKLDFIDKDGTKLRLTPKALERVYELQKTQADNKNVFVAMSFHESAKEIREAIKRGVSRAGFLTTIMDEVVHNHQIVPEMLRLIRESKLMIMDITDPNYGAYYEAGYALGLGKEVIITCSEDVFRRKEFFCSEMTDPNKKNCVYVEKSLRPHFDIAQKQILVWKNYEDLTKKLSEWIKYTTA